jgi:acetoin utilization deacetylase AcuC-like enzyme
MRIGLFDDPVFDQHDAGAGHPERPERLEGARRGLKEAGLDKELVLRQPRPASRQELLAVHTEEHVDRVAGTAGRSHRFDPDTAAGPHSYKAALKAAGAVAGAVEEILDGELDRAFCIVRPPGHHATSSRAMGFCLFNNVAVGAAAALEAGLERVAIVDPDVHHGNGTQEIFWEDPRVLYVSSHQFPFYPGTGALDEVGEGPGRGFTVNLPMPGALGDQDYSRAYREIVEPVGRAFDPQLVLISAGFDAHEDDPLGGMKLTAAGFAEIMDVCVAVASGSARGRVVAVLEGGYSLEGLASSTAASVARLLDRPSPPLRPGVDPRTDKLLEAYRKTQASFWPILER